MCIFARLSQIGDFYSEGGAAYNCMSELISDKKFGELLKCFGEGTRENQITNLKNLIDDLRSISEDISKHSPTDKFVEKFNEELVARFSDPKNDSRMWDLLKLINSNDNNRVFFMTVMLQLADYNGGPEDLGNIPGLLAMRKIKSLNGNSNKPSITNDKAELLLQAANLRELIDRNKIGDIVEILKFAPKHSLSFEDIFPSDFKLPVATCVKLMAAVKEDSDLKNFAWME
jgi:hypothetical protein